MLLACKSICSGLINPNNWEFYGNFEGTNHSVNREYYRKKTTCNIMIVCIHVENTVEKVEKSEYTDISVSTAFGQQRQGSNTICIRKGRWCYWQKKSFFALPSSAFI